MTKNRYEDFETDDEAEFTTPTAKKQAGISVKEADDDDTPAKATAPVARTIKRGWGAAEKIKEASSDFAQRFKVLETTQVIKFLEDEPYASFRTHWIERTGQKSFTCLHDSPQGCPLCDAGNRPSTKFAFNIGLMDESGDTTVKSFEVGVRLIDQLKNFHNDPRQGPLSKNYWAVSKTGKGSQTQTVLQMVRERDLEEWALVAISDEQMTSLVTNVYDASILSIPTRAELLAIATELLDAR